MGSRNDRKRKHAWNKNVKPKSVEPGLKGLVFTCREEKRGITEAYRLIDEHITYDWETVDETGMESHVAFEKQRELIMEESKNPKRKQRKTGVKNCLFVNIPGMDPSKLALDIVNRCQEMPTCKFLDRVIPVEITDEAELPKLNDMIIKIVCQVLGTKQTPAPSYAMEFKARNNDSIKKADALCMLNDAVKAICPTARVNFANPDITIFIQVVKTTAMIGIAPRYQALRRYSLRSDKPNPFLNNKSAETSQQEQAAKEAVGSECSSPKQAKLEADDE